MICNRFEYGSEEADSRVKRVGYCRVHMPSVPRSGSTWFRTMFETATSQPSFAMWPGTVGCEFAPIHVRVQFAVCTWPLTAVSARFPLTKFVPHVKLVFFLAFYLSAGLGFLGKRRCWPPRQCVRVARDAKQDLHKKSNQIKTILTTEFYISIVFA